MSETVIRQLTPELLGDFLRFFDDDAFADNPSWAHCYCMYYHCVGADGAALSSNEAWNQCTGASNRAVISELIRAGQARGLLAYVDGKPVGWCHAAPRSALPKMQLRAAPLAASASFLVDAAAPLSALRVDDPERVGSIVCFVVAQPYRGQGLARCLLTAACDVFQRQGLAFAEAYPARQAVGAADNYHGPLSMYLRAGFTVFRELDKYLMVRKRLCR